MKNRSTFCNGTLQGDELLQTGCVSLECLNLKFRPHYCGSRTYVSIPLVLVIRATTGFLIKVLVGEQKHKSNNIRTGGESFPLDTISHGLGRATCTMVNGGRSRELPDNKVGGSHTNESGEFVVIFSVSSGSYFEIKRDVVLTGIHTLSISLIGTHLKSLCGQKAICGNSASVGESLTSINRISSLVIFVLQGISTAPFDRIGILGFQLVKMKKSFVSSTAFLRSSAAKKRNLNCELGFGGTGSGFSCKTAKAHPINAAIIRPQQETFGSQRGIGWAVL